MLARYLGDVAVAAVPVLDVAPAAAATDDARTPWGGIAPVLGAVATGIGVVGFVTFVGIQKDQVSDIAIGAQ